MKLKNSKVVVTGGAGLIGSWVVELLLKENVAKVIVIDNFTRGKRENLSESIKSKKIKVIRGDIRNLELLNRTLMNVDYVIHEAAIRITKCAENPRLCNEVLIDGTFNIFDSCVKNKVKKIVFNSSASVYGNPSYLPMDENHPYNNDTAYGAAKIANEHMAKAFNKMFGLKYVCLRPFNVYGPRMDAFGTYTEVLIKWLEKIKHNHSPVIHGNGKQSLDFVYVEDVAKATISALKSPKEHEIYNVGSGKETNLNKLAKIILKLTNSKLKPIYKEKRFLTHVNRRRADLTKIKKDLNFAPEVSLEEGLKRTISWYKKISNGKHSSV